MFMRGEGGEIIVHFTYTPSHHGQNMLVSIMSTKYPSFLEYNNYEMYTISKYINNV